MEFSVNIVDRIYNNLVEYCASCKKDINEYICDCIENKLYTDMYGDLNKKISLNTSANNNVITDTMVVKLEDADKSSKDKSEIVDIVFSSQKQENAPNNTEKNVAKRTRRILKSK